ncbi:MAG: hypothetical protein AB3N23_19235 [Paracoccaceae bacterium]
MSQTQSQPQAQVHTIYAPLDGTQAMFRQIEVRMSALEAALGVLETERAVSEEKRKFMEARFNQIDTRLERIDGHISRLVWLIIAAIVGGVMSVVMQGGGIAA